MENMKRHTKKRMKRSEIATKIFYVATAVSVALLFFGLFLYRAIGAPFNLDKIYVSELSVYDILTFAIPFSMWAWLIICGTLLLSFGKKNWLVLTICIVLAIPNAVVIMIMCTYGKDATYIFKWYVEVLSFGLIVLKD